MGDTPSATKAPSLTSGICELTLESRDPHALASFYSDLFGWEMLEQAGDRIWLACGTRARLGIWSPGEKEFGDQGGRHVHFALSVGPGRLDELKDRLDARALDRRGPVEHEGGDRSVYFEDPEGNVVEAWDFFEHGQGAEDGVDALDDERVEQVASKVPGIRTRD